MAWDLGCEGAIILDKVTSLSEKMTLKKKNKEVMKL